MASGPYDPDVYRRFAENLRGCLAGRNIERPSMWALRRKALATARRTANGSSVSTGQSEPKASRAPLPSTLRQA